MLSNILYPKAKGQYIALCEDYDYWIDDSKIQKQASYLDSNSDFFISGHDAFIIYEKNNHISDCQLPDTYKRDYAGEELVLGKAWILSMSSQAVRQRVFNILKVKNKF